MKIEYLKQMHDANVGDVKDVAELAANVLIKLGVAKPFEELKPLHKRYFFPIEADPTWLKVSALGQVQVKPKKEDKPIE